MAKRFLRQAGTGEFYPYTDHLSQRPDMVPVENDEVPVEFGGDKKPRVKATQVDRLAEIKAARALKEKADAEAKAEADAEAEAKRELEALEAEAAKTNKE